MVYLRRTRTLASQQDILTAIAALNRWLALTVPSSPFIFYAYYEAQPLGDRSDSPDCNILDSNKLSLASTTAGNKVQSKSD